EQTTPSPPTCLRPAKPPAAGTIPHKMESSQILSSENAEVYHSFSIEPPFTGDASACQTSIRLPPLQKKDIPQKKFMTVQVFVSGSRFWASTAQKRRQCHEEDVESSFGFWLGLGKHRVFSVWLTGEFELKPRWIQTHHSGWGGCIWPRNSHSYLQSGRGFASHLGSSHQRGG